MQQAIAAARRVRCITSPNPWVGCVIVATDGQIFEGATYESTLDHAEVHALKKAGDAAYGATAYVTLEPCSHYGQTPPCARALIDAGVSRVVIGIQDPDDKVSGTGITQLRDAKIVVEVGICEKEISEQLAPYIKHRTTGRPYVVLKLAMSLDGYIAHANKNYQWITGNQSKIDVHKLRAESDAILVGANTVRIDDPELTVREWKPDVLPPSGNVDPQRIVLGPVSGDAKVQPCRPMAGDLESILDELGKEDVVQLMVEGGASIAREFHSSGLVDKYVFYIAPSVFGEQGTARFASAHEGNGDLWRGKFETVEKLGSDLKIECVPEG